MPFRLPRGGGKYNGKERRAEPRKLPGEGHIFGGRTNPTAYASGLADAHGLRCWFCPPPVGPKKPSIILLA
jgi:hypothetical protein